MTRAMRNSAATFAMAAIGLIVACAVGPTALSYGAAADGKPIAGIQCERQEYGNFHIHAHLDVFVDGKPHPVPESIGIIDRTCLYWLHTHDPSGIIHVEAPQRRIFTLDQFFDIWQATAPGAPPVKQKPAIFVNGKKVSGGLDQVELTDFAEIAVVYGKAPAKIPSSFDFPGTYKKDQR
jgi:hypothetical protein